MGRYANKRIGILGGTFNPVHNGHLYLARQAICRLRLDKVVFVPAYIPPHKKIRNKIKAKDRVAMLALAVKKNSKFSMSQCEIKKKGTSYSVNTAVTLRKKYGKHAKLFFLIGADSFRGLKKWKDIGKLLKIVNFAVFSRPGFPLALKLPGVYRIKMHGKRISSTEIRRLAFEGRSFGRFVPGAVSRYIKKRRLYL